MRVSKSYAMAASIAALCVAAPAAMYLMRSKPASAPEARVALEVAKQGREIAAVPAAPAVHATPPASRVEPPRANVAEQAAKPAASVASPSATVTPNPVPEARKASEPHDGTAVVTVPLFGDLMANPPVSAGRVAAIQQPLQVVADEWMGDTTGRFAVFRGNIRFSLANVSLTANELIYERHAHRLTAVGNVLVRLREPDQAHSDTFEAPVFPMPLEIVKAFGEAYSPPGAGGALTVKTARTLPVEEIERHVEAALVVAAKTVIAPGIMREMMRPEPKDGSGAAAGGQQVAAAVAPNVAAKAKDPRQEAAPGAVGWSSIAVTPPASKENFISSGPARIPRDHGQLEQGRQAQHGAPPMSVAPSAGAVGQKWQPQNYGGPAQADAGARLGGQVAVLAPTSPREPAAPPQVEQGRDRFGAAPENPVKQVATEPVSTFSIDVDTASYSFVRRSLNAGRLPPKDAVRVEEMINYFPYAYARPESAAEPFHANVQVFPSPWNASNQLVHIGLKGYDLKTAERPRANLVFLVDISGSMAPADRLPLLKNSFRMLLDNLQADDTVAIVTYAAGSDIRLAPTRVADKARIIAAIDSLNASGSTHGAAGINDAYRVAEANFDKSAVNRVILATDGDWNVGITNRNELKSFIERKRETGIFLSILGVGMGNHNDALMQTLAQSGNGAAAYIDTLSEARKVLVDEASSTLFPIAKDVKIQLEFNPAAVSEYRLIGYETRMLKREDFNNDKVDAGDLGSGHSVTAIYEITPVGAQAIADGLRYQPGSSPARGDSLPARDPGSVAGRPPRADDAKAGEIGFLKLRYKLPKEEASRLATFVIGFEQTKRAIAEASTEARFSVAVAAFGQLLRGGTHLQKFGYDEVIALANGARGEDPFGYRAEFVNLVRLTKSAAPSVGPR